MLSRQLPVRQKSLSLTLPSSHSSGGLSFGMPSPQYSMTQRSVQPSPEIWFPSSHCSIGRRILSPQIASRQAFVQLSVLIWLPSSHCSPTEVSSVPFPHALQRPCGPQTSEIGP